MTDLTITVLQEYGTQEIPGQAHNPEVLKYFTDLGLSEDLIKDETAWCSALMNWAARQAGYEESGKPDARSWLKVGTPVDRPQLGDIVILWRENINSWKGHVAIYVGEDEKYIFCLGGNQNNTVNVKPYPKERLLGYRRLKKLTAEEPPTPEPTIVEVIVEKPVIKEKPLSEYPAGELFRAWWSLIFKRKK